MLLYTSKGTKVWLNRDMVTTVEMLPDNPIFVEVFFGYKPAYLSPFTVEERQVEGFKEGLRPSEAFDYVYQLLYSKY